MHGGLAINLNVGCVSKKPWRHADSLSVLEQNICQQMGFFTLKCWSLNQAKFGMHLSTHNWSLYTYELLVETAATRFLVVPFLSVSLFHVHDQTKNKCKYTGVDSRSLAMILSGQRTQDLTVNFENQLFLLDLFVKMRVNSCRSWQTNFTRPNLRHKGLIAWQLRLIWPRARVCVIFLFSSTWSNPFPQDTTNIKSSQKLLSAAVASWYWFVPVSVSVRPSWVTHTNKKFRGGNPDGRGSREGGVGRGRGCW